MKYSEAQTHKVHLQHRDLGDLGEAQLRFGGENGVVATMGFLSAHPGVDPNSPLDFVHATAEDGHTYTLCACRIHGFSIIATFLVHGSITESRFRQIAVRYSDISEWFLRWELLDGVVGQQLTWTRRSEHFSVAVTENTRPFTLSSKCVGTQSRRRRSHRL